MNRSFTRLRLLLKLKGLPRCNSRIGKSNEVLEGYRITELIWSNAMYMHTYNHYNSSDRIVAYLLTSLMLRALILYINGGIYSLTSTPNDRFLRNFFMAILFTCQSFHISFLCLTWNTNPGFMSNKSTGYLLDYGDISAM